MRKYSPAEEAKEWFINHYPLLGSLATAFKVIYDSRICIREEISIAAVDVKEGAVYINPAAGLNDDELKFVMAHELLHAGLCHHERCLGRDFDLWNASCDYVINGWLKEMKVGTMVCSLSSRQMKKVKFALRLNVEEHFLCRVLIILIVLF